MVSSDGVSEEMISYIRFWRFSSLASWCYSFSSSVIPVCHSPTRFFYSDAYQKTRIRTSNSIPINTPSASSSPHHLQPSSSKLQTPSSHLIPSAQSHNQIPNLKAHFISVEPQLKLKTYSLKSSNPLSQPNPSGSLSATVAASSSFATRAPSPPSSRTVARFASKVGKAWPAETRLWSVWRASLRRLA